MPMPVRLLRFTFALGVYALFRVLGFINGSWVPGLIVAVLVALIATIWVPRDDSQA